MIEGLVKIYKNYYGAYLICPIHWDVKMQCEDIQMGMSGTYNTSDENIPNTIMREINEELCLEVQYPPDTMIEGELTNGQNWWVAIFNVNSMTVVKKSLSKVGGTDDKKYKIGGLVYGLNRREIEYKLKASVNVLAKSVNEDDIRGLTIVPIVLIIQELIKLKKIDILK